MFNNWLGGESRALKCAAVTPVGPGHAERARECRASIEAAWRQDRGPFTALEFFVIDDGRGELGRSKARNMGVEAAHRANADWIFFLDADDLMSPRAFAIVAEHVATFDAVWGLTAMKSPGESAHHIRFPQTLSLRSLDELLLLDPFITLSMGHFVRTAAAQSLRFNEALDAGEDFDYYVRAWEQYRCIKIGEVLSINRADQHSTGPRAATAEQWRRATTTRLAEGLTVHGLSPRSSRAISALNRVSEEAQAFSRARGEATADALPLLAARLPHRGFVDVSGVEGGDFVLFNNNDDTAALSISWIGEYQPASTRLWQRLCRDAALIVDACAQTGYYTLLAARAAPAAEIVSYEPSADGIARLRLNVSLNDVRNVNVSENGLDAALARPLDTVRVGANGASDKFFHAVARAKPRDLLLAINECADAQRIDVELRKLGYRYYAIDDAAESIVPLASQPQAADAASPNRWATLRPEQEAQGVIAAAYCTPDMH